MIKLKNLLTEAPDNLYFNDKSYNYDEPYNRSSFFTYPDLKDNVQGWFGFSDITKKFFCDRQSVLDDMDSLLANTDPNVVLTTGDDVEYFKNTVQRMKNYHCGGSHSVLNSLLRMLKRSEYGVTKNRARLFEVPDKNGKNIFIASFWSNKDSVIKDKTAWDACIKANNVNPEEILYEISNIKMTYNEAYGITSPDASAIQQKVESEIEKEILKKNEELTKNKSDLHTKGVVLTIGEKEALEDKILLIEVQIELLEKAKAEGKSNLQDIDLQTAILMAIHRKPKSKAELRNAIFGEFERVYPGMSYAEIRQKLNDAGVELGAMFKAVIKEYKKCKKRLTEKTKRIPSL